MSNKNTARDPLYEQIERAPDVASLVATWKSNKRNWTTEHNALAAARRALLEGGIGHRSVDHDAGVRAGRQARDEGMVHVEDASDQQARALVDQAIAAMAETGEDFSANRIRENLVDVRPALIGSRFMAASRRGIIVQVGLEPSSERATHAHRIAVWRGTAVAR